MEKDGMQKENIQTKTLKMAKNIIKKLPQISKVINERNEYAKDNIRLYEEMKMVSEKLQLCDQKLTKLHSENIMLKEIIDSEENSEDIFLADKAFIREENSEMIVAYVPIELLFTETYDSAISKNANPTNEWIKQNKKWENLNIMRLKPHKDLYNYFSGITNYPSSYIEWFQNLFISRNEPIPLSENELMDKKYEEYQVMDIELSKRSTFFEKYPIVVQWNVAGYFNILDGHHRAMFLLVKGIRKIPALISKRDYLFWRNQHVAQKCMKKVKNQGRQEFYTPILNPFFYDIFSSRDNCSKTRMEHILNVWGDNRFYGYKVLDVGANIGYFSRCFTREGAIVTAVEPDSKHYELAILLNLLSHTNYKLINEPFQKTALEEKYDICLLLTVLYHFMSSDIGEKMIYEINRVTEKYIIWESGDCPDYEKQYIMSRSKFKYYKKIASTYGTGKKRELGVFTPDFAYFEKLNFN